MKILTITDVLANRGGLELLQTELCSQLAARGHQVRALYREGGDLEAEWRRFATELRAVPTVALRRAGGRSTLRFARAALASLALPADLIYVHYYEHLELAWLAARAGRKPIIAHLHLRGPASLGPFGRRLVRVADRFVAISGAVGEGWAAAGVPRARIDVVHNGVDTATFTPASPEQVLRLRGERGIAADAFVVVYAGRMVEHKGAGTLVAAMSLVQAAHPGAILVLAGSGTPPGHPATGIRHIGHLSRQEVVPLLQLADVVVVPTLEFDGCPLVVAEALACGIPVVASSVGGIPEQLSGDLADWLVPPGRPDLLGAKLSSLSRWRAQAPYLAARARARAVGGFSRQRMVDGVERSLEAAVSAHR